MCAFIMGQLLVFYKGGMVFSPFYNYGMYAQKMKVDSAYSVTYFPDMPGNRYSPQAWDKIYVTLTSFSQLKWNAQLYDHDIKRLYEKLHLPIPNEKHFISNLSEADYWNWYNSYLKTIRKNSVDDKNSSPVTITYFWNGNALTPINN